MATIIDNNNQNILQITLLYSTEHDKYLLTLKYLCNTIYDKKILTWAKATELICDFLNSTEIDSVNVYIDLISGGYKYMYTHVTSKVGYQLGIFGKTRKGNYKFYWIG